MATASSQTHKHFQLDAAKLKRAQKALQAKTEPATIELALDLATAEHQRNHLALAAHERFVRSGIEIKGVFGRLDD